MIEDGQELETLLRIVFGDQVEEKIRELIEREQQMDLEKSATKKSTHELDFNAKQAQLHQH